MLLKKFPAFAASLLAVAAGVDASRAQTYLPGIDVSHWQGSINWNSVAGDGIKFAFMKATQGNSYVDPTFATNIANATAAGVKVGPYHFCDLDTDASNPLDPVNEANHFLDVIKPYYDTGLYLPPVADVEGFPAFSSTAEARTFTSSWVQSFSDTIYDSLGVRPIIYTSLSKANSYYTSSIASQHELWLAWWKTSGTANPPTANDAPLWGDWQFWQWTNTSSVAGVSGTNLDSDLFNGTMADLEALLVTTKPPGPAGLTVISNFNTGEDYFGTSPTYSGSNRNIVSVTAEQTTTEAYEGAGSEKLAVSGANWTLRFLSGIGSPPANPATNLPLPATGNVGFWLKTTSAGLTTQILIDDGSDNVALEGGVLQDVVADGQWHLYQWDFQDDAQWNNYNNGDGVITESFVTIDSILFKGTGDSTIYLDMVAQNPDGSLTPPPGDMNGDYVVNEADLDAWKSAYDAGGETGADFLAWQRALGATSAVATTSVPEPATELLTAAVAALAASGVAGKAVANRRGAAVV